MFERIISIDWSGAGEESRGVDLRIAQWDARTGATDIVDRQLGSRTVRSWSRAACRDWLEAQLRSDAPALIACDFGFGYCWGADQAIFGVSGWHAMIQRIATLYRQHRTARATAQHINTLPQFEGHGPFRFNESRNDFRFYMQHGISYYRLCEMLAPQSISQWYLGAGGTVGFHSITGMAALHDLVLKRQRGDFEFEVWPQETLAPTGAKHVFAEVYPSLCPRLDDYGPCQDDHQRDAWKVLQMIKSARDEVRLSQLFDVAPLRCGRVEGVPFEKQLQFEGFILGLH